MNLNYMELTPLRITRVHLGVVVILCFLLCAAGVCVFWIGQGKNGFDTLPLAWHLILVVSPMISLGCLIAMSRVKVGSKWWLSIGALLVGPQLFAWLATVDGVLHYLGIVNHGLFFR